MGTRHLIIVKSENKTKVAQYGQWDGYPTGQGKDIATFLQSKEFKLDEFKKHVDALKFITKKESDAFFNSPAIQKMKSEDFTKKYPEFSRDTGAKLLPLIQKGNVSKLTNHKSFLKDGLFCEYAYELDLNKKTVTVYVSGTKVKTIKFKDFTPSAMEKLEKKCQE